MRKLSSAAFLACILLMVRTTVWAQAANQGTIEGTITDPSGAVVPGAVLTATNNATGVSFTTETNPDGLYRFIALPVGAYTLKISKQGFADQTRNDVPVTVGGKLNIDV